MCGPIVANRHCCWAGSNLALLPPLMQEFKRFKFAVGQTHAAMCRPTVVVKLKVISFKTLIFKSQISTTHVALNIGSKAGSWRNATIFAFNCKTYCCKTYVRHCKENAPIYMYYVAPETPMMSSVIVDCPDLVLPIFWTSLRQCLQQFRAYL